ncbi:MAG: hypothetical protein HLUCCA12_16555 [Rhodobacteraceae bacterium HLUCCA12]|nr:MAG: hypothetical protein HLUCCA12_16555 [Rhodobacteraceae bacterium HLUCCA12]
MTQSRCMSLVEAFTNVIVGYALAVATQIAVFPWFGLHANLSLNLALGAVFTGTSLVRSYALRRLFEMIKAQYGMGRLCGHCGNARDRRRE